MRHEDVHLNEMSRHSDDQSRDDLWPAGDPALAAFVDDLRTIASGPAPEPRPGLVTVMRQGPSVPTVSPPGRRKMLVKTIVGSLAAKLAFGVGAAAASVTAAGAVGVLPDPAQHAVASVVEATTPFALPDPSAGPVSKDVSDSTSTTVTTLPGASDDDGEGDGATRTANHGACVSAVAKANTGSGAHGKTVSSIARSDCGKTAASTSTTVSPTTSTTVPGSSTTSTSVTTSSVPDESGRSANSGRGNGTGNSGSGNRNGNSGSGNSGSGNSGRN